MYMALDELPIGFYVLAGLLNINLSATLSWEGLFLSQTYAVNLCTPVLQSRAPAGLSFSAVLSCLQMCSAL